jgi:hypothetical protein
LFKTLNSFASLAFQPLFIKKTASLHSDNLSGALALFFLLLDLLVSLFFLDCFSGFLLDCFFRVLAFTHDFCSIVEKLEFCIVDPILSASPCPAGGVIKHSTGKGVRNEHYTNWPCSGKACFFRYAALIGKKGLRQQLRTLARPYPPLRNLAIAAAIAPPI